MKNIFVCVVFLSLVGTTTLCQEKETPSDYVNPFLGTQEDGHTFPGAAVPFGMVQLSPETDTLLYSYGNGYDPGIYRYCAGYQYNDSTIVGFSHTHFSGTGHSDLGDFLIMPTVGELKLNPGVRDVPRSGYRSRFSHSTEVAHPGYYAVTLDDYNIRAELTATERVGFHKYTFPRSSDAHIILDMTSAIYNYAGKIVWDFIRVENDTLVTGYRQTDGWARTRYVYFAMVFSKPFKSYGLRDDEKSVYRGFWGKWNQDQNFPEKAGRNVKAYFNFDTKAGEPVLIKFALSGVSSEGALKNLQAEIKGWDFDKVKEEAKAKWNKELSKITVKAGDDNKTTFYTALYHCFLSPIVFSDVDGKYRGLDQNIHQSNKFMDYTVFSLWDTYRALHPLYTIIERRRTGDIINSMLAHYEQSAEHMLPVWSHWANENWCMIGYHAVPVIVDAYMKGIREFNVNEALKAVVSTANCDGYDGIGYYKKYGYVPEDLNTNSASKTLEYAYDDWTIYRFAESLGKKKLADEFLKRAESFRNIFDPQDKFMRAKNSNGTWKTPFDPLSSVNQGYIEGNALNYSLYVPQDIKGLIDLMGGSKELVSRLDTLFTLKLPKKYFEESEDVTATGMVGDYDQGNEPSHHVAYMYCYAGEPWKTQERIHEIVDSKYNSSIDGLCGNDDCGQMSAWYIFSAMGFYPVTPGSNQYVIGSPCVDEAKINLENGKSFTMKAENFSAKNIYIEKAFLNGKSIDRCYITQNEIMNGGELRFVMSSAPNKSWGVSKVPYSMTK